MKEEWSLICQMIMRNTNMSPSEAEHHFGADNSAICRGLSGFAQGAIAWRRQDRNPMSTSDSATG